MLSGTTAALGVAEAGNVAEILRVAGPKVGTIISAMSLIAPPTLTVLQGMHVKEIASKNDMDAKKLCEFVGIFIYLSLTSRTQLASCASLLLITGSEK